MPDREKVVKGLEECVGNGNCTKCQYGKEKQALSCKKLLTDALILLKKQEAQIRELEEKLRVLEYGDQGTLKSAMMPAT